MLRCKLLLLSVIMLALVLTADATQQQPATKDAFGDALPEGAVARLGTVRWRHGGVTTFAAFLPGGKTVISAGMDKTIRVWEYPSGKELHKIGSPVADIPTLPIARFGSNFAVALSHDGKTVAGSFAPNEIRLSEVATGKTVQTLKTGAGGVFRSASGLAFSPDGQHLAVLNLDNSVHVWDWATGMELRTFGLGINAAIAGNRGILVWSPDGKALATVKDEIENNMFVSAIKIWDPATGKERSTIAMEGRGGGGDAVFTPDSKTLAFANIDGTVMVVDVATGKTIRNWKSTRGVSVLVFSQDGAKLYGRSPIDRAVLEWDAASGKELRKIAVSIATPGLGRLAAVSANTALSPDGKLLVLAGNGNGLQFLDLAAGKEVGIGAGHVVSKLDVQFTPDGKHLLSRSSDGSIHRWEAATGKALDPLALAQPLQAVPSPDGKVLVVPSAADQTGMFADAATGKELGKIPILLRNFSLAMLFSPDGKTLAVRQVQEKNIALFEVPTGKLLRSFAIVPGGPGPVGGGRLGNASVPVMFFTADGKTLAAFADPATLALWDTQSGERVGALTPISPAPIQSGAFSPDGRCIALDLGDGTVALYELASGKVRRTYGSKVPQPKNPGFVGGGGFGTTASPLPAARVAFGRDGQMLMHAGLDHIIHVWDVTSGQEVAAFKGHAGSVNSIAVAPNGKTLASASADTTALLWDLTRVVRPATAVKALAQAERDAHWQALFDGDAAKAFAAICDLSAAPQDVLVLIKEQVKPAPSLDMKRVQELIAELDSDQFKVRQQANADLIKMGERVVPAIDKVLATNVPLETKNRLEGVRKQLAGVSMQGERLRVYRAVEILERIGSAEARQLLQALADGAPGALVTTSAQAALVRLGQSK
jgi:WD40 repeat protein